MEARKRGSVKLMGTRASPAAIEAAEGPEKKDWEMAPRTDILINGYQGGIEREIENDWDCRD